MKFIGVLIIFFSTVGYAAKNDVRLHLDLHEKGQNHGWAFLDDIQDTLHLEIANKTRANLTGFSVQLLENERDEFVVLSSDCGNTLLIGEECGLLVRYSPIFSIGSTALIEVRSDAIAGVVELTGARR